MMLKELLNTISILNHQAEISLDRKAQKENICIYRREIQLSRALTSTLQKSEHITYIGQTLRGEGTPYNLKIVVAVSSDGCLSGPCSGRCGCNQILSSPSFVQIFAGQIR